MGTIYLGGAPSGSCPTSFSYDGVTNYWFSYDDGTLEGGTWSHKTDIGGCDVTDHCAYHAQGGGFTGYGAGVGLTLNNNAPFDASMFGGMQLYLRGVTQGTRGPGFSAQDNVLHVKFVTGATTDASFDPRLGDDFGAYCPLADAEASTCYEPCTLQFSGLTRDGFRGADSGAPDPSTDMFDPANLVKLQFEFSSFSEPDGGPGPTPVAFDVWIDAITFLPAQDM
jgi:hypothetical protein